jgi:hypothetical protein
MSRQPIKTKDGVIWVDSETAQQIKNGEIDPNREATPEEIEAGESYLRSMGLVK